MCGIIGISGSEPVAARLIDGLKRLEYRGYDSAGLAIAENDALIRLRAAGKVANLEALLADRPLTGATGIAHTRWATHGAPNEANAHPHVSGRAAIVHNGIIENFQALRNELEADGRVFQSETDSEAIAQLLDHYMAMGHDPVAAFEAMLGRLVGAFAIAAVFEGDDGLIVGARRGSPLVLGFGARETYLGSDAIALASLTREVTYLEDGDWVVARPGSAEIRDEAGRLVNRPRVKSAVQDALVELGEYEHFMRKEIHEQPEALARSILPFVNQAAACIDLGAVEADLFAEADRAVGVACGTAYHSACVAMYWFEELARLPFETDVASEFRYRAPVLPATGPALFVSQSGETADTFAALRYCRRKGVTALAVVNVEGSTIAREADGLLPTRVGPEIGVASTKAFTAQLGVLAATAIAAGRARGHIDAASEAEYAASLTSLPRLVAEALAEAEAIAEIAKEIAGASDVLFIGRGRYTPVAYEGALKLKEISYIHAEAYAAGELKHGAIALIEAGVPVVVIAPKDALFEKTVSNMKEVQARGARVILVSDDAGLAAAGEDADRTIRVPDCNALTGPVLATVPLQLLAYHTAVFKGTDVDKPRNLAKSVTVE